MMGTMTDPTSRTLSLLSLLQARASWRGDELAAELGVTARTLRRDVERLRRLGYTVQARPGSGGGYSLGRGGVLPPLTLDEDQAVAVTLALIDAAGDGCSPYAEAALRALRTIDDVTPTRVRERLRGLRTVAEDGLPSRGRGEAPDDAPVDTRTLLTCAEAVRRTVRLSFSYTDRRAQRTERRVEPHRLVPVRGRWKLVAFDLDREDWRTFRLDRLSAPAVGTWRFAPRPGLEEILTRLDEPAPPSAWRHEITARIHAPLEHVAASLPRLAGHLRTVGPGETEFRSGAEDPDDAARWLTTLRHDFTLVGDDAVAAAVERLARRLGRSVAVRSSGRTLTGRR